MREAPTKARFLQLAALVGAALAASCAGAQDFARDNHPVTIEYIAHACFRVTSPSGKQVLIDPYASRVWLGYDFPPDVHADAVLISHPHYDHDGGESKRRPVPWCERMNDEKLKRSKRHESSKISCSRLPMVEERNSPAFNSRADSVFHPFVPGGLECCAYWFNAANDSCG